MKRFYMRYESDKTVCGSNAHNWGSASTLKTAKGYIAKCRKEDAELHPRNFKIFDITQDDEFGHALCVYAED